MHISFKNCTYEYRPGIFKPKSFGIKNITLDVEKGEAFGFLGHNGAGKTTAIKCLMGLQYPTEGEVLINGISSSNPEARRKVGFLPEQPYFYDHLSIYELLSFFGGLAGIESHIIPERIDSVLDKLGLKARKHSRLRTLSKGLMQRVGLAQALLSEPELLVLDEPFSGLDPIGRREFRDIFQELKSNGVTLFMSSHILSDVEALCSRAAILVKGEIKNLIDLREKSSLAISKVLIRASGIKLPEGGEKVGEQKLQYRCSSLDAGNALASKILNSGGVLEEFSVEHENLEDIFIKTVSSNQ